MSSVEVAAPAEPAPLPLSTARHQLLLFGAAYLILWTICAALIPRAMHIDSIEQVVWSQSWQWGYYKHPPLPSALMRALNLAFGGPSQALTAFAAQGSSVVAMGYVWLLARQMLAPRLTVVAVLLTSLLSYHTINALTLNHNTVSLPFTAAAFYYFYRGVVSGKRRHWLCLGVAAALAMLTKYSAVLALASLLVFVITQRLWRDARVLRGLALSLAVFGILLIPHVHWLIVNHFPTFHYAEHQLAPSKNRFVELLRFLINQASRVSVMALMAWLLLRSDRAFGNGGGDANEHLTPRERFDRRFLLVTLCVPLALAVAPALLRDDSLDSNWVTAYFLPSGILLAHCLFRRNQDPLLLRRSWKLAGLAHVGIIIIFFAGAAVVPEMVGRNARFNFPSRQLADQAAAIWHAHEDVPLRLVVADTWTGGNLALHLRPEPMVFMDHSLYKSRWLRESDITQCGALVLTTIAQRASPAYAPLFSRASATGEFPLDWGFGKRGKMLDYAWAVVSPVQNGRLCRFKPR